MSTAMQPATHGNATENYSQLLPHIRSMQEFMALFTPGKMEEELWQFACRIYEKQDTTSWTAGERYNVYAMYNLLLKVCRSLQEIMAHVEQ